MEEAALDHGEDRLPFNFSFFGRLLLAPLSLLFLGTTFGPIPLAEQIRHTKYTVHGKILTDAWVEKDRKTQRPFTLWKLQILDIASQEKIEGEITIREVGGEIDGMGHHVSGSAKFQKGEEIVVILRDSDEPNMKDVVGLASGKYTVARIPRGEEVRSFIGKPLIDTDGKVMTAKSLLAFANRVYNGKESEADRNVFVNKEIAHDDDPVLTDQTIDSKKSERVSSPSATETIPNKNIKSTPEVQTSPQSTEEPSNGSTTGKLLLIVFGFVALLAIVIRIFR